MSDKADHTARATGLRELTEHQQTHTVQRYHSGEAYSTISKALDVPWNTVKPHRQVEKIWNSSDISDEKTKGKDFRKSGKSYGVCIRIKGLGPKY